MSETDLGLCRAVRHYYHGSLQQKSMGRQLALQNEKLSSLVQLTGSYLACARYPPFGAGICSILTLCFLRIYPEDRLRYELMRELVFMQHMGEL